MQRVVFVVCFVVLCCSFLLSLLCSFLCLSSFLLIRFAWKQRENQFCFVNCCGFREQASLSFLPCCLSFEALPRCDVFWFVQRCLSVFFNNADECFVLIHLFSTNKMASISFFAVICVSAQEPGNQTRHKKILKRSFSVIIEGLIFHNELKEQEGKAVL